MRGLAGLGGGGLITMATIINSDIIPLKNRGMYQAVQNGCYGFGAICGASLGGFIADTIGWRWCFLCQVPISFAGLVIGYLVIVNPPPEERGLKHPAGVKTSLWRQIDLSGAVLLILGLSTQLAALSLGGNQYPWSDTRVVVCLVSSFIILGMFVWVELRTKALPVMPMYMLKGRATISNTISNVMVGMSSFAVSSNSSLRILYTDIDKVPIHDPTFLPSRSPRLGVKSWTSTRHPIPLDTSGWPYSRIHHVEMGNAQPSCTSRMFFHDPRQWSNRLSKIPRFDMEIHSVSLSS